MTSTERKIYFGTLWPAACHANEWDVKDDARRRAVTLRCMQLVRAPLTDSTSGLGRDAVTALFTYLAHLGDPASLDKSARWVTCQEDYKTFNRAKQADWHEHKLYGAGKNRLNKNRFAGETTASGGALNSLNAEEVWKRHITMASRHQRKMGGKKGQKMASQVSAGGGRPVSPATQSGGHHAPGAESRLNPTTQKAGGTTVDVGGAAGRARKKENPF